MYELPIENKPLFGYKRFGNKLYVYYLDKREQLFDYNDFDEAGKAIIRSGIKNPDHLKKLCDIFEV